MAKIMLTGVKSTGSPHIGNYLGAIGPALKRAEEYFSFFFIADYHALNQVKDKVAFNKSVYEVAATWLALGLDPSKCNFYRQSAIPEIFELAWILACSTPKSMMNKAHSYKDAVQNNQQENRHTDEGINMGLYTYPILMAADILAFNADIVPVGKDQLQHIEFARDMAGRFNESYGKTLKQPEAKLEDSSKYIVGLDGRKMSKSYGNTIKLFSTEKQLRKTINSIVTNSQLPSEPKDPDNSTIFSLFKHFASDAEITSFRDQFNNGISWGDAKGILFEQINTHLTQPREVFNDYINNTSSLDEILANGAEKASVIAKKTLEKVRNKIGV